ncbi:glycosyltransferase family 2 protein [Candidatus Lokiarchaeum ossiferum]|uniref:glycosyltransferase family 2 protein n=1 Tax=Candidatus Lokiarchaeum ossiferum TaxID=2951803 RepID=UPI00352CBC93
MNNSNFKLSIIFVNYKSVHFLKECMKSLEQQTYKDFQVIIVDNTEGDQELVKIQQLKLKFQKSMKINVLKPKINLGFAGGNNYGLRRFETNYYLLLNCDTELLDDSLEKCISFMDENPKAGMMTPKLNFFCDKKRIWYAGTYLDPQSYYFLYHIGLNEKDCGKYDEISETAYACGAALFTRNEVIKEIGLLDETYFAYFEETDWNIRAKKANYKIMYYPKTTIYHKVQIITKENRLGFRGNPFQNYLYTRNRIIFMIKNYSFLNILGFFLKFNFKLLIIESLLAIYTNRQDFFLAHIRAHFKGLVIGIRRRTNHSCKMLLRKELKYLNNFTKISRSSIS